jgi:hypothetical protein
MTMNKKRKTSEINYRAVIYVQVALYSSEKASAINKARTSMHASMRSRAHNLDLSKNLLVAGMVVMLSVSSLTILPNEVLAFPDKFGIDQLYSTEDNGPLWFLDNEDPEDDDNFLITSADDIDLEEEDSNIFKLDAETGTQKHGVRIHADSPDDDWKNVEMTGYFKLEDGNDQFTLVARQGPTYNDDGGCGAYGYYGMLSAEGDAYFKKKLFHHGGYSDRTAVEENVVDDLDDRWVGIKLVVYDLDDDEVKLELWVDDGNEENNWKKATEYVDDGDWEVSGSDCDRSDDDIIEDGTRGGFRVDDSEFEFKKLSIREIAEGEEEEGAADEEETGAGEEGMNETEALVTLQRIAELGEITDSEELGQIAEAADLEELAELVGASDSEELSELVIPRPNPTDPPTAAEEPPTAATPGTTDSEAIEVIARVPDLEGLAELVGASDLEELLELVIPQPPAVDDEEE